MTIQYSKGTWALTISNGFSLVDEDADVISFQTSNGQGVLQISSYLKDGVVNDGDLAEFSEEFTKGQTCLKAVKLGDFVGFATDVMDESWSFKAWFLRCRSTMIFATYTCNLEDKGIEETSAGLVLGTLAYIPQ